MAIPPKRVRDAMRIMNASSYRGAPNLRVSAPRAKAARCSQLAIRCIDAAFSASWARIGGMTHAAAPPAPISWRWIALFWFAAALFEATQSILIQHAIGGRGGEVVLFLTELAGWLPWALATPFVIELAQRHPIVPAPTARGIGAHLMAFLFITLIAEGWSAALHMLFNPWAHRQAPTFWDTLSATLIFHGLICVFAYALILAITYLVDSRDKVARKATEAAQLGEELSKAQLAALLRQMEPHFMFNTLNSIAGLVRDDRKAAAVNMIVGLSEILRRTSQNHKPEVTLAEEIEYLQRYIDIQKVRFGERLGYDEDVPETLMDARVPSLLLQPLVENAIKHGLTERVAGGEIRITAARQGAVLSLSVYNDGPAFAAGWESNSAGVGLANLRTRLRIMYGDAADLDVRNVDGGAEVVVTLPLSETA
ncbi:sensor histidine kinase [Sphingosinicella sp. LHD-64]|uniref:sensor histidine kinase n=1 Tax=Sphingosinicella sp. LHD-64 TaxID=3072139 RepID=UPI00281097A8|nr:sensor histidine kinase [Sphingosinicella sp. LHD-64]MDQ8756688.1 sensor histidine kinase [Sphingosinicella sp. LHD-64]